MTNEEIDQIIDEEVELYLNEKKKKKKKKKKKRKKKKKKLKQDTFQKKNLNQPLKKSKV